MRLTTPMPWDQAQLQVVAVREGVAHHEFGAKALGNHATLPARGFACINGSTRALTRIGAAP